MERPKELEKSAGARKSWMGSPRALVATRCVERSKCDGCAIAVGGVGAEAVDVEAKIGQAQKMPDIMDHGLMLRRRVGKGLQGSLQGSRARIVGHACLVHRCRQDMITRNTIIRGWTFS